MSAQSLRRSLPQPPTYPKLAWLCAAMIGAVGPFASMGLIAFGSSELVFESSIAPILAIGLMGTGMIAASADGRLSVGLALALGVGTILLALGQMMGTPMLPHLPALALTAIIASISFAVRGALFARSQPGKGWLIAVFVVAGEAAIVLTALAQPGALPDWLLALLPAQWTSAAIQSALSGAGVFAAWPALVALSGTAAATGLVAQLWPARWTYLIMFGTWLSLSALVYYQS